MNGKAQSSSTSSIGLKRVLMVSRVHRPGPGPRTEAHLRGHEGKVVRLRGPKALERWLATLPDEGAEGRVRGA